MQTAKLAVSRYLQDQPGTWPERVAAWREQRDALRGSVAEVAAEPIPMRLQLDQLIHQRLDARQV